METREKKKGGRPIDDELADLRRMTVPELCQRYQELFGEPARRPHRQLLWREIAWRLQALGEGGLPEHVKQYALAIARNSPLRVRIAENASRRRNGQSLDHTVITTIAGSQHDSRLPLPGSLVIKEYRGQTYVVKVLDTGFEYDGRRYRSLSAIAQDITGTKWNGYLFFGLTKENTSGKKSTAPRS
ncbi:MAG TPA: DUF2924 domain-containing protein [Bryobacteraceae bacterium]|nr:DUF2924 domain-containing protein [Bryobacteraceae bacterium]